MIAKTDLSDKLAFDSKGLDALKSATRQKTPESIRAAATQFEALFVNMMLKSMRQAGGQDGMFDNEQSRLYSSMLDQQFSQKMASRGLGLADALVRQMSAQTQLASLQDGDPSSANDVMNPLGSVGVERYLQQSRALNPLVSGNTFQNKESAVSPEHVQAFKLRMSKHAQQASRESGIPAQFMLGQAALESGWGQKELKSTDGRISHNLFGIKAGAQWTGKTVDAMTTEYVNGSAVHRVEKFRAYDNYGAAFSDYAKLITDNPRYQQVLQHGNDASSFAYALQKAGYASDPQYAQKLTRIIHQSFI